ncbi:ABC transporter ATP-binding protein [Brachybacterium tyrofermentans]|uniref:ABC transporter ATP-binding protein n=1 Tax=Brachybacterium tyrofermentans TaxID=47848 RepID=UPI003F8F71F3
MNEITENTSGTDSADSADSVDVRPAPTIELHDVHVVHKLRTGSLLRPDTIRAVDGVSVSVRRGEVLGIVGESGSGKSTLARVMTGLQPVTSGTVLFDGRPFGRSRARRRELGRTVSVVFQDPATALNPRLPVRETLMDPLRVHDVGTERERLARVTDLLHLVGLPQSAMEVLPRQISGGQRQRVAIARALALEPQIIVADEPTSALDVSVRAQVLNLLMDLKRELGLGLVFISHDISTVRFVSDSIIVMNRGKVVEHDTAERIFTDAQDEYTRTLLAAAPSLL